MRFAARDILGETVRIVPKHIWEGVDSPAQSTNENPVGTGHSQKFSVLLHKFMFSVVIRIIGIKTLKLIV